MRLEVQAHNYDDTPGFADNAGKVREKQVIEAGGPENELLTLPVADLYCARACKNQAKIKIARAYEEHLPIRKLYEELFSSGMKPSVNP